MSVYISNIPGTSTGKGVSRDNSDLNGLDCGDGKMTFLLNPKYWTKVYEKTHKPSQRVYQTMDLASSHDTPIIMRPGEVRLMYIHSTLESDAGMFHQRFHFLFVAHHQVMSK
jgi:hypothetical protein